MPTSASDPGSVAVDGRDSIPSRFLVLPEAVALELVDAASFCVPLARAPALLDVGLDEPPSFSAVHALLSSLVGDGPADAFATRHVDPDGVPAAPLPPEPFAPKSSEAEDGCVPQFVPRLASVGTPGDASAVKQVEAFVGSSAEPIPASDPANEPVALATAFARTRESEVERVFRLASAFADGPDVVGAGVDPSGVEGCAVQALIGAVAVVPGPVAVVVPAGCALEPTVFALDAVTGSLDATEAGPASSPLADAEPPAVELFGSGWTTGCAATVGPSASAGPAQTHKSARVAMTVKRFLIA